MFESKNVVRMHDTDMAGILYFARQFRFMHDAWEDFLESEGMPISEIFRSNETAFVIAHASADYLKPLFVGDKLRISLTMDRVGTTSFSIIYKLYRGDEAVGTGKTVHVCIDLKTRSKRELDSGLRSRLQSKLS